MYVWVLKCRDTCVKVRGQFCEDSFFFCLYLNSSGQTHIVRVEQKIIWVTSPVLNSFSINK